MMRNLNSILKALSLGLAVAASGCEDNPVPPTRTPVVTVTEVKTLPAPPLEAREVKPLEAAPLVVATDEPDFDTDTMKPSEILRHAREAIGEGDLDEALRLARIAVEKSPHRSAAWNVLGRVQLSRGERKHAIASLKKAVELNPSSSWASNNLGLALIYDGKYEEAVAALEEATGGGAGGTVEPYMWNNLGMALEHLDRLDQARDAYRKAAEADSRSARLNLARLEGVKSVRIARADIPGGPGVGDSDGTATTAEHHDYEEYVVDKAVQLPHESKASPVVVDKPGSDTSVGVGVGVGIDGGLR